MKDLLVEGRCSKGGVNNPPTTCRPLPPKGQGGTQFTDVQQLRGEEMNDNPEKNTCVRLKINDLVLQFVVPTEKIEQAHWVADVNGANHYMSNSKYHLSIDATDCGLENILKIDPIIRRNGK